MTPSDPARARHNGGTVRPVEGSGWRRALEEHHQLIRLWRSPEVLSLDALMLWSSRRTEQDKQRLATYLDEQGTTIEELVGAAADPTGAATSEEVEEAFARLNEVIPRISPVTEAERRFGASEAAAAERGVIEAAATWAIAPDMVRLISAAAQTMPVETVERSDVPEPTGFVWLDEPMIILSDTGARIPFRALRWHTDGDRIEVICYRARGEYSDQEQHLSPDDELLLPRLSVAHQIDWRFGDASWSGTGQTPQVARFLKALWTIAAQRLATVTPTRPDRSAIRRAQRDQLPVGDIRVVTLRRLERDDRDPIHPGAPEWTHRWIVSGHWRNQYLPATGLHRLQWIAPHIKGPDDKPLVLKHQVTDLAR